MVWDLRHTPPLRADGTPSRRMRGRFVLPGAYRVRLTVGGSSQEQPLRVRSDPALELADAVRRELDATLAVQAEMVGATAAAGAVVETLLAQTRTVLDTLEGRTDAPAALAKSADALLAHVQELNVILEGPGEGGIAQQETVLPLSTLVGRLYGTTEAWTGAPTADQTHLTDQARQQVTELLRRLASLLEQTLPDLRRDLAAAGIPWPAGEVPVLPENLLPASLR